MRKIKNLLLVIILFMFVSVLNVDAAGVSIKSVDLVDSNGNVQELSKPKVNGLNINFDLAFGNMNDSVIYEVVINNTTSYEYEINTEKQFGPSNYISYSYDLKDKTNRIKANSEVTLYITISYDNPVPNDKLTDGKYIENNDLDITLLNEKNPNTFNNMLWLIFLLFILIIATLTFKYSKKKNMFIVVLALLFVPVTVFALEKLKLTVTTKITVDERYGVYYLYEDLVKVGEENNNSNIAYCYDDWKTRFVKADNSYDEYKYCLFVEKDENLYKPGDRVNVPKTSLKTYDYDSCEYDDQNKLEICPDGILVSTDNLIYDYECGFKKHYITLQQMLLRYTNSGDKALSFSNTKVKDGKTKDGINVNTLNVCTEEELYNMNFNSYIERGWEESYGYTVFVAANQFTMPRHDVYINKNINY